METIFRKLRKYEIQIRKAVVAGQSGVFRSIYKGSGLEFDDVREYQYGDDVRTINWNVSAKGHGTYIKTFKEERDQHVFFLVDISASENIGKKGSKKLDLVNELTGVLTLTASNLSANVGLLAFSDSKEMYVKPSKGIRHAYELIGKLYHLHTRKSLKTDLSKAIRSTLSLQKKRSVIIIISDFIDEGYQDSLKLLAKLHDVILFHVSDPREEKIPSFGIIPVLDIETGKTIWSNSSSFSFKKSVSNRLKSTQGQLHEFCKKHQIDYMDISTSDDYVPRMVTFFKQRNKVWKRA